MVRLYYLRARKAGGNIYATFFNPDTGKEIRRLCTGTSDEKQADAVAKSWLANGLPPPTESKRKSKTLKTSQGFLSLKAVPFWQFLYDFWDFDKSDYFKEKITEGKDPKREHPLEMQGIVTRYYKPYFKNTPLADITEEKLTRFLVHLKVDEEHSASTVNLTRNAAFVALKFAIKKKNFKLFDFKAVIRASGEAQERGILEREKVEELFALEWIDPRTRMANRIASQTGMRISEIQALRLCDIKADRICVNHSYKKVNGGLRCCKNREKRVIPILPELSMEIHEFAKSNCDPGKTSFLFKGRFEAQPLSNNKIIRDFYLMLNKMGISEEERKERVIVFHSWRHYAAAHLARVTNRVIGMAILGQKTSRMFDHYANHFDNEAFNQMAEAISAGLKPATNNTLQFPVPPNVGGQALNGNLPNSLTHEPIQIGAVV